MARLRWGFIILCLCAATSSAEHYRDYVRQAYGVPDEQEPAAFLVQYISERNTTLDRGPARQEVIDRCYVEIADAYHWLGHLAQEAGKPLNARVYFAQSLVNYLSTDWNPLMINPEMNGANHAEEHLRALYKELRDRRVRVDLRELRAIAAERLALANTALVCDRVTNLFSHP